MTSDPRAGGSSGASYVFVVGTGRCGSSLVQEVLARHPDVAFVSNVQDRFGLLEGLGRWNNATYRYIPPKFTRKGRVRYAPSEAYRALDRRVSPIISSPGRSLVADDATPWLSRRFRGFFEQQALRQRAPVLVHKFTGWPRSGFVRSVFYESKFINVVRDGRAVANSFLQMPWWLSEQGPSSWNGGSLSREYHQEWLASGQSYVLLAGLRWKLLVDAYEQARDDVPADEWLTVRYEDTLADPKREFGRMLEFMGLSWNRRFAQALSRYDFDPGRTRAYERDLDERNLKLLTSSLSSHLQRYGYQVWPDGDA